MADIELTENWKVTAALLERARHAIPLSSVEQNQEIMNLTLEYQGYFDHNELGLALDALGDLGHRVSCRRGFWRDLERAAINMGLTEKALHYRQTFLDLVHRN